MKRALLLLPLLLFGGCAVDRKAQLESALPDAVTKELRAKSTVGGPTATHCIRVGLTEESKGHYVGMAHFESGSQTKITVTDDGNSYYFETAPF